MYITFGNITVDQYKKLSNTAFIYGYRDNCINICFISQTNMYGLKKTSQILPMNFCIVLYIETITVSIFFYIKTIIVNDLVSFLNLFPLKSQYLLTAEKVLLVHVLYNHYVPATDYMCTCKDIVEISFYYNALLIKILYSSISTFLKLVKNSLWRNT